LINVKVNHSDAQLAEQLSLLEATLDARIIPLADLGLDKKKDCDDDDDDNDETH
jgi:hypothetical protein